MNLASILDDHPDDAPALVSQTRTTTYGALRERTAAFRGALEDLGVGPGDRVALLSGNDPYFIIALLATVGLGAVAVPLVNISRASVSPSTSTGGRGAVVSSSSKVCAPSRS